LLGCAPSGTNVAPTGAGCKRIRCSRIGGLRRESGSGPNLGRERQRHVLRRGGVRLNRRGRGNQGPRPPVSAFFPRLCVRTGFQFAHEHCAGGLRGQAGPESS